MDIRITTDKIMSYSTVFEDYTLGEIKELWKERKSLTIQEIIELNIEKEDRILLLCHILSDRNRDSLIEFGCCCAKKRKEFTAPKPLHLKDPTPCAWWAALEAYWTRQKIGDMTFSEASKWSTEEAATWATKAVVQQEYKYQIDQLTKRIKNDGEISS